MLVQELWDCLVALNLLEDYVNCYPQYVGGDPFTEVFDGIAIANSAHGSMDALKTIAMDQQL